MNPTCRNCNALLQKEGPSSDIWEYYSCPRCSITDVSLVGEWLPTDKDTNLLFCSAVKKLAYELSITCKEAINILSEYYTKFTDADYCKSIGIPVQDDDFFHHEGENGLVLRAAYYLVQNNNPDPGQFINWRANVSKKA